MGRRMRFARGIGFAIILFWASIAHGFAQTAVTLTLTADGDVAAAITEASLPPDRVGYLALTVRDDRGLGIGWDLVLSVDSRDVDIALLGRADVVVLEGQPVVAQGPNAGAVVAERQAGVLRTANTTPGTNLGHGTSVLRAAAGAGSGSYALRLAATATHVPDDTVITLTVGVAP